MAAIKSLRRGRIKMSIRKKISGTSSRPRLSIYRSNKGIYAQLIDDDLGKTIASASSLPGKESGTSDLTKIPKIEQSKAVGRLIAEKAIASGIRQVVFDRNGYLYHGRVKSLAEGAREGGLQF